MPVNYTNGQCCAIKLNDEQCKNNANADSIFCGSHQNWQRKVFTPTDIEVTGNLAESYANTSENTKEYVRNIFRNVQEEMTLEEYTEQFMAEMHEKYDFIVAVTGSRSLQIKSDKHKREVVKFLVAEFQRLKEKYGKVLVTTGIAEGFDTAAAKAAQLVEIDYLVAIPSPSYGEYYWGQKSVTGTNRLAEFEEYVDKAAHKVIVCKDYMGFAPRRPGKANFDRNQWMVDFAQAFYVYDHNSRGTKDCVARIKKAGTPRIFLDNHMEV